MFDGPRFATHSTILTVLMLVLNSIWPGASWEHVLGLDPGVPPTVTAPAPQQPVPPAVTTPAPEQPAPPAATTPAPHDPAPPADAIPVPQPPASMKDPNFLRAEGSRIIDQTGHTVVLTGVNWFGMETGTYAPHGVWQRNWEEMLDQVAALGFNTIRLPFSSQLFDPESTPGMPNGIDFKLNPDLAGLSGVEIMDQIVEGAGKRGLKVILDRHRPDKDGQSSLWYTDRYPEERWIHDWEMLARRYLGNDAVIGADLHNEPRIEASWGSGDRRTDWQLAAERAGNAILSANPNWLIIVEGVSRYEDREFWWGGNLRGAKDHPVRLNVPGRLVYSAHDYGPGVYVQSWFLEKTFPNNLSSIWDTYWGYLAREGIAPVLLGEFGGRSVGEDTEGIWQRTLVDYVKANGINYTYWCLNPNSGDTGGILNDDWQTVNQAKLDVLRRYQAPRLDVNRPTVINRQAAPGRATLVKTN